MYSLHSLKSSQLLIGSLSLCLPARDLSILRAGPHHWTRSPWPPQHLQSARYIVTEPLVLAWSLPGGKIPDSSHFLTPSCYHGPDLKSDPVLVLSIIHCADPQVHTALLSPWGGEGKKSLGYWLRSCLAPGLSETGSLSSPSQPRRLFFF